MYSHAGYDFTSYFRSTFIEVRKTAENAASDGFGLNLSGGSVLPAPPNGGHL